MRRLVVLLALCPLFVACGPQEQIASYEVQRTRPPSEPFDPQKLAAGLDHLLVGMVPLDDQVWFFKLVGKAAVVTPHRQAFEKFLAQVKKGDSPEQPIAWVLPEGWKEGGPAQMRFATVVIPDPAGDLEITISSLPQAGAWDDFLEANVMRWLGQLGQGALPRQTILNLARQVPTAAGPATVIELAGQMQPPNPHGGMGAPGTMAAGAPPSSPPSAPPPTAPADPGIKYQTPDDWQPGQMTPMRRAAFRITAGDQQAEVTISTLNAADGPQVTDVAANVSRWGGQVGLPPETNWEELIEPVVIDGLAGSQVKLTGPTSATPSLSMLVAMVVREQEVWFIKLWGSTPLVEEQGPAFQDFLRSIHFE